MSTPVRHFVRPSADLGPLPFSERAPPLPRLKSDTKRQSIVIYSSCGYDLHVSSTLEGSWSKKQTRRYPITWLFLHSSPLFWAVNTSLHRSVSATAQRGALTDSGRDRRHGQDAPGAGCG